MNATPESPSDTNALHEDLYKEILDHIYRSNLEYLNLCGLSFVARPILDDDSNSPLAYLHLRGMLAQLCLSEDFKSYYEMFVQLRLGDCFDLYQDVVMDKFQKQRESRILEQFVKACVRFRRCDNRHQRKKIFDRLLNVLYSTNSQETYSLKIVVEVIMKNDPMLREISIVSLDAEKLNYFLFQLKNFYPSGDEDGNNKSVQNPLTTLMNQEVWGPVHKCFTEGSVLNLAVTLNHGFQQKICPSQLHWYLRSILTRRRNMNFDEKFFFWFSFFMRHGVYDENKLFRRLFLTLQFLYVIMHDMEVNRKRCLRLIWKTIPDHYITAEELEMVMRELPTRKKMIKAFEEFSKSPTFYEVSRYVSRPRDLKHYCRCQIRNCLILNNKLPEGILSLELPRVLETYLLLEAKGVDSIFLRT